MMNILTLNFGGDWYTPKWAMLVFACLSIACFSKKVRSIDIALSFAFLSLIASGVAASFYGLKNATLSHQANLGLVLFSSFLILLNLNLDRVYKVLPFIFGFSVVIGVAAKLTGYYLWGIGGVSSVNSLFVLLLGILSIGKDKTDLYCAITWALLFGFAFISGGTVAIVASVASALVYFAKRSRSKKVLISTFAASSLIFSAGLFLVDDFLVFDSRLGVWSLMLEFLMDKSRWIFGMGFGTSSFYAPVLQEVTKTFTSEYFYHAHSDILQLFFEVGIAGLIVFLIASIRIFFKSWKSKNENLPAFYMALFVGMAGYMPAHLAPEAVLIATSFNMLRDRDG